MRSSTHNQTSGSWSLANGAVDALVQLAHAGHAHSADMRDAAVQALANFATSPPEIGNNPGPRCMTASRGGTGTTRVGSGSRGGSRGRSGSRGGDEGDGGDGGDRGYSLDSGRQPSTLRPISGDRGELELDLGGAAYVPGGTGSSQDPGRVPASNPTS
jgi:hypothetical protein